MIPFEKYELDDWKASPITQWWFGKMQDEFATFGGLKPVVHMDSVDKTAMAAAYAEGLRAGFSWALNFQPEDEGDENQTRRQSSPRQIGRGQ